MVQCLHPATYMNIQLNLLWLPCNKKKIYIYIAEWKCLCLIYRENLEHCVFVPVYAVCLWSIVDGEYARSWTREWNDWTLWKTYSGIIQSTARPAFNVTQSSHFISEHHDSEHGSIFGFHLIQARLRGSICLPYIEAPLFIREGAGAVSVHITLAPSFTPSLMRHAQTTDGRWIRDALSLPHSNTKSG